MELLLLIAWILPVVLWIWAIIDIIRHDFRGNNKIVWVLMVLFLPFFGALLYLLIGSRQKI